MLDGNRGGEAHQIKVGLQRAAGRQDVRLAKVVSRINAGWLVASPGDLVYVTEGQFEMLNAGHGRTMLEWEEAPPPAADDRGGPQPDGAAPPSVSEEGEAGEVEALPEGVPGAPVLDDEDDMHRMIGGPPQTPLKERKKK